MMMLMLNFKKLLELEICGGPSGYVCGLSIRNCRKYTNKIFKYVLVFTI